MDYKYLLKLIYLDTIKYMTPGTLTTRCTFKMSAEGQTELYESDRVIIDNLWQINEPKINIYIEQI